MHVLIVIHYLANENKVMQKGEFPLKGRTKEQTALDFWKWIRRQSPYADEIVKVLCDGEDITEQVKELKKCYLKKLDKQLDMY